MGTGRVVGHKPLPTIPSLYHTWLLTLTSYYLEGLFCCYCSWSENVRVIAFIARLVFDHSKSHPGPGIRTVGKRAASIGWLKLIGGASERALLCCARAPGGFRPLAPVHKLRGGAHCGIWRPNSIGSLSWFEIGHVPMRHAPFTPSLCRHAPFACWSLRHSPFICRP